MSSLFVSKLLSQKDGKSSLSAISLPLSKGISWRINCYDFPFTHHVSHLFRWHPRSDICFSKKIQLSLLTPDERLLADESESHHDNLCLIIYLDLGDGMYDCKHQEVSITARMTTKIVQTWLSITLSSHVRRIMMNNDNDGLQQIFNRKKCQKSFFQPGRRLVATRLRGLVSSKTSQVPDEDDDDCCDNILVATVKNMIIIVMVMVMVMIITNMVYDAQTQTSVKVSLLQYLAKH